MDGLALLRDDPPDRSRRADDLHDRQPGAGDARWRRSSTARSATCSSRCRSTRCWRSSNRAVRRAQAGAGAARGQRWSRSWRASRSAIGRGWRRGSRRRSRSCGWPRSRSSRGRGGSTFAYETLLRTDEPTLRSPLDFFDAAERLGRAAELGRIIRRHVARAAGGRCGRRATCSSTCTRPISEDAELYADDGALTPYAGQVVLEITERAALDRHPRAQHAGDAAARARLPHRHRRPGRRVRGADQLRAARARGGQGRHVAGARHRQLAGEAEAGAVDHRALHASWASSWSPRASRRPPSATRWSPWAAISARATCSRSRAAASRPP